MSQHNLFKLSVESLTLFNIFTDESTKLALKYCIFPLCDFITYDFSMIFFPVTLLHLTFFHEFVSFDFTIYIPWCL